MRPGEATTVNARRDDTGSEGNELKAGGASGAIGEILGTARQATANGYRRAKRAWWSLRYLIAGRKPWTQGYSEYKEKRLSSLLDNKAFLERFLAGGSLPAGYGFRLDERIVEYLWVIARLGPEHHRLLDAGSTLNHQYLLKLPVLRKRSVTIVNLSREDVVTRRNVAYVRGDLRRAPFKSESFEEIVCMSTLEHVGMDSTAVYSQDRRFDENRPDDYRLVMRELNRLLRPRGRLYVSVPYGRYEHLGWLQQFDSTRIETMCREFGGSVVSASYYRYFPEGWRVVDADACEGCRYFDIHSRLDYEDDYVAAARAVVCLELRK